MIRELLPPDTGLAFGAMRALRTDLESEEAFVRQVDEIQRPEGSGVGLERVDAHRFYMNAGMIIASHHFARLTA